MTVSVIFLSINSNNELQRERKKKKKKRNAIVRYIFSVTFRGKKKVMKNSFKRHGGHVFTLYGISKLRLTGRGNAICS